LAFESLYVAVTKPNHLERKMTDEELRELVASNARSVERLNQKAASIDGQLELTQRQINLLVEQTRSLAENQAINETRFTRVERQVQGIYELLGTFAKEQAERSQLIDRQIQSLIDERRRS
jgi:tyrosine-protein phosphatase YwqE